MDFRMQLRHRQCDELRQTGFAFCDDTLDRYQRIEGTYKSVRQQWEEDCTLLSSLIVQGMRASSTDNDQQTIGQ